MTPTPPRPTRDPSGPSGRFGGRNATIAAVVVAVLAVVVGFVLIGTLVGGNGSNNGVAQDKPTVTQTPTQPPGHTQQPPPVTTPTTATPPHEIALHCSAPPAIPSNPQQWKTPPPKTLAQNATWNVTLKTNCGNIVMALDGKDAPQTVSSFLFLSQHHYFDDTKCHRLVTSGIYVLQCGDPTGTGTGGPGYGYGMENAPANEQYPTGTVAMARTSDPNSNGSQFFIVYQDSTIQDPTGYSIFGKVSSGLQIVQAIAQRGLASDGTAPAQPISILSVTYAKA